ncbi:MAG: tetratricopeptide repeat protein, partial [Pseudomonadales bacterium]
TGLSPYGDVRQGNELRSAIIDGQVQLPRTALASRSKDQLEILANSRSLTNNKLTDALRGDLTSALLKALARSPEARYDSAAALAQDLRNWQESRPLTAANGATGYVLRKFFARNRLAVVSAAVGTLALTAVAIIATNYSIESARQNTVIKEERDRAEQIQKFLLSVFALNSPNETKGASVSAKELLDRGAARVDEELADQPRARAEIKLEIAAVYSQLGLRDQGEALLRTAAAEQREEFGSDSYVYANTLERLAELVEMDGKYDEALALAQESLDISRDLDNTLLLSYNLVRVARIKHLQGDYAAVGPMYQEAIELQEDLYGADSTNTAETMLHYGSLLQHLDDHQQAEAVLRRALHTMRSNFGEQHTMTMSALINLAPTLSSQGRYEEALGALDRAHAISTTILGTGHPDNRYILNHKGRVYMAADRLDDASTVFAQAAELVAASIGADHPDHAVMVRSQADVLLRKDQCDQALPLYWQADAVLGELLQDNPSYWDMHRRIALCQRRTGDLDLALARIEQVIATQQRLLPPDHKQRQNALQEGIAIHALTGDRVRLAELEAQLTGPVAD